MPLQMIRNDITKVKCDAIVNAANTSLLGGGGVDGAIHRAAGPQLLEECRHLHGCKTGQAKITGGYRLPCKYVIHTPGPIWRGGTHGEEELLRSCYINSLKLAKKYNCGTVAFPLISAGVYGYPKEQAVRIAYDTISDFISEEAPDMLVYMVIFDKSSFLISKKLHSDLTSFIDDNYVDEMHKDPSLFGSRNIFAIEEEIRSDMDMSAPQYPTESKPPEKKRKTFFGKESKALLKAPMAESAAITSDHVKLEMMLKNIDESFSEMLLRKIDEKNMKDSECYKKANIDRKLFSKIRSDRLYKPSKNTVIAFAIALELPLDETKDMLRKAGFALSHSSRSDIIIEYFILNGIYDIFTINETLFYFDQKLLGA